MLFFVLQNSIKYIEDIFISHLIFNENATLEKYAVLNWESQILSS